MTWRTLKEFTEWYLGSKEGVLKIRVPEKDALRVGPHSTEFILYREPPYQITLLTFFPGYVIPPHTHKYVSTYNLSIHGDGHAYVAGRYWTKKVQDQPRLDLRISVPANVNHFGHTEIGTVFLSCQKWEGKEPGFLSQDWVCDTPFGKQNIGGREIE